MCFTIPQKIKKITQYKAITDQDQSLDSSLVSVKMGDWVLEQNGLIIAKISSKQARDIFKIIKPSA